MREFVIVDIESTGLSASGDFIIEIGMVKIREGQIVQSFQSLIKPTGPLTPFVQKLTGINPEMLEDAPSFSQIFGEIKEFIGDAIFVAHNVSFDVRMMKKAFSGLGVFFDPDQLCTVKLSKKYIKGQKSNKLTELCLTLGIPLEQAHRAFDDAQATAQLFLRILNQIGYESLIDEVESGIGTVSNGKQIPIEQLQELGNRHGVLKLFGVNNALLYCHYGYDLLEVWKKLLLRRKKRGKDLDAVLRIESIQVPSRLYCQALSQYLIHNESPLWVRKPLINSSAIQIANCKILEKWGREKVYLWIEDGQIIRIESLEGRVYPVEKIGNQSILVQSYLQRNRCQICKEQ